MSEVEQEEEKVRLCKIETGLSLAQLENAWSGMNKSARSAEQISRELGVSLEKLRAAEQIVKEANRHFKKLTQETGLSMTALKRSIVAIETGEARAEIAKRKLVEANLRLSSALRRNIRTGACSFWT